MKSKTIATTAIFAALAVILNSGPFKIPAPYAPFLYYQIWEIPIVTAFLLFGPTVGAATAIINAIALLILFPGALPSGPVYNLVAILGMLLGVCGAHWIMVKPSRASREAILPIISTALGASSRVVIMSVVNSVFLKYPPPVGFSMSEEAVTAVLPIVGFFNASLALYTIPAGYILAKAVSSGIKTEIWKPKA